MRADLLLKQIDSTVSKKTIEELAKNVAADDFSVTELIDLTFHKDEKIGFRAAWVLETLYINHADKFIPHATYFLTKFTQQDNLSARRNFAKILALMTARKVPIPIKQSISDFKTEGVVETVFEWLIAENVPVAIKSHCLNILANFCSSHDWVRNELMETMEFLVDKESIAFYAKVKQIRKQLLRER